jgi:HEAT repeat protein
MEAPDMPRVFLFIHLSFLAAVTCAFTQDPGSAVVMKESRKERVRKWLTYLSDDSEAVRHTAVLELGMLEDTEAVAPLVNLLSEPKAGIRRTVVLSLGRLKDKRAFGPVQRLLSDVDLSVRQQVVVALGELDREAALPFLNSLIQDEDTRLRSLAVSQLRFYSEPTVRPVVAEMLRHRDPGVRESALRCLEALRSTESTRQIEATLHTDENEEVRDAAASILLQLSPESRQLAIDALKHPNVRVRQVVTEHLRWTYYLNDPKDHARAKSILRGMLKDASPQVRSTALASLFQIHGGFCVRRFDPVSKEISEESRVEAPVVSEIIDMLHDRNAGVRALAAQVLGALREEKAVSPLIGLLDDPGLIVRLTAAHALGKLGDQRALKPLLTLGGQETKFGASLTINMAVAALVQELDQNWMAVEGLNFPVEIGIHQVVEAPVGEGRRLTVLLQPQDFSETNLEALCRYFSAEFPVPEEMSISIQTDRTRIEQERKSLGLCYAGLSYPVEQEVEMARRMAVPNRYLYGYYTRERRGEAFYFSLPGDPAKTKKVLFKGQNPWPH